MTLTAKQESFALAIVNGKSQTDAYKEAYDTSNYKDNTIHVNASQLVSNTKVASRIAELRKSIVAKELWTREKSVKALIDVYNHPDAKCSDKTASVKELNCMHGFNAPGQLNVDHKFELLLPFVTQTMIDRNS
jgi:phage terminase small subunit